MRFHLLLASSLLATASLTMSLAAQTVVLEPEGQDTSAPLHGMAPNFPTWDHLNDHPIRPVPHGSAGGKDNVLQNYSVSTTSATVGNASGFDGVGLSTGLNISGEPPDTEGSVGATQYVQWVNTSFARCVESCFRSWQSIPECRWGVMR